MIQTDNTRAQADGQVVAAVRQGDAERYRELVERYERLVYAVAWSRLGDASLAEEATQEAFIRGYRRLWLLGDGAKFSGWITSIARRVAINFGLRHRRELNKRERWALEQTPGAAADDAEPPCTPETLRQTLAELPDAHRECLVLFYLEGKSGAEAAAALGISEATLRVRLHRARAALRERLENRLADSLVKLAPGKTLVPAVMVVVLASSSAKAATTGGAVGLAVGTKLLASAAKILPFAALFPLLQIVISLPGLLVASWIGRVERRNYRDAEGFRARLHRDFYRSFLWGFPLLMLFILLPIHSANAAWGIKGMYLWTLSLLTVVTLIAARSLTINRNPFQIGMLAYSCIIVAGTAALALGWLPPVLSSLPMVLATVVFIFVLDRHRPMRMDYNLFLRATQNLLKTLDTDASAGAPPTPQLDRSTLLAFARFLGSRWLAANFRWERHGLALRLPPVKTRFLVNIGSVFIPMSRGCSRLLLRPDATVVAHCGTGDAADLTGTGPDAAADPAELEWRVAATVEQAWREFREGNAARAERALGELPEAEVFVVSPARAASTRWMRIFLGVIVLLMVVAMVMNWRQNKLSMVSGRYLRPVSFAEADVRAALAQLGEGGVAGSNALREVDMNLGMVEVLPARPLFTSDGWQALREHLLQQQFHVGGAAAQRVDRLLGTPNLLRAVANGWLGPEDFGLASEDVRRSILDASEASRRQWFATREVSIRNHDSTQAGFTVLDAEEIARRVQCLQRFGCLDVADGSAAVEVLLKHQVLSGQLPAGRRALPFPKLVDGTFFTFGFDPIHDTYFALVILDGFGALERVDREACIRGILRFHHGNGLFGSVQLGDRFAISGDSRDTFWAFESLRMLGGLDRVKDLPRWQFRPIFVSKKVKPPQVADPVTWSEIDAWVCQQRLARIVSERERDPSAPVRSLLAP